jgi:hypothetical protein
MRKLICCIGGGALMFASAMLGYSAPAEAEQACQYMGQSYSHGSQLCMGGSWYWCKDGNWTYLSGPNVC